ncbi:hypothetical protein RvY_09474 [Ramazzottius varieornatus]|uniref:RWD domain-containing protein n=1 Tax=Ramazzottius varieornatus TaxID=947166 RepID=A0A1D1VBN7_RAMVA|nr:hypothetical protein RvY_09474 [Ramazzottius varieornatus]
MASKDFSPSARTLSLDAPEDAPVDSTDDFALLRSSLTAQLNEIEILESMYSMPGEFFLHDQDAKAQLDSFCRDRGAVVPSEISYDIRLQCENAGPNNAPVEVVATVTYPYNYPDAAGPNVYVRFLNQYHTRQHQSYLNKTLSAWIKGLSKGEACVLQIFSWIEQNTTSFVSSIRPQQLSEENAENQPAESEFERLWIYSHHIYSKHKREMVMALAKNLELSGFMLIGKPGIICVEGMRKDARAFYDQIKRFTWQKIALRHQEAASVSADNISKEQKFVKFKEMSANGTGKEDSQDMSDFIQFLKDRGCGDVIPILFAGIKVQEGGEN